MRFKPCALTFLLLLIAPVLSVPSFSQKSSQNPGQLPDLGPNPGFHRDSHDDQQQAKMHEDMAKRANRDRQAQLQRDTGILLKLANELKQEVDKSNENTLSLDVVKKAEEIEKLAHSVKEKMKAN